MSTENSYNGELIRKPLDQDGPDVIMVSPSVNRMAPDGPLAHTIGSLQRLISTDNIGSDVWMLISDGSDGADAERNRLAALNLLDMGSQPARLFFRTPELRAANVQRIIKRTGLRPDVVRDAVNGLGYGNHRETVDNDIRAIMEARGGRPVKVFTSDDDVQYPDFQVSWNAEGLAPHGLQPISNSQVMSPFSAEENGFPQSKFDTTPGNSIKELFETLGKKIGEIKRRYPDMRVTEGMRSTENNALFDAVSGKTSQLEFTHGDEPDLEDADNHIIVGTSITKTRRTDASTYQTALNYLRARFPDNHMAVESYRSGPNERFAIRGSNSIYPDSAVFARYFDQTTAYWIWWYASSLEISLQNKLQSVTGHYRADNDRLPHMLNTVLKVLGAKYTYALGFDTEAFHSRSTNGGNRQDLHKGVMSSMVGNIAAVESVNRMVLDRESGLLKIDTHDLIDQSGQPNPHYQAPLEKVQLLFDRMLNLVDISKIEIAKLEQEMNTSSGENYSKKQGLVLRFQNAVSDINARLGGPNLQTFHENISPEIRDQVIFFRDLVNGTPKIVGELQQMIRNREYMVDEYVREPEKTVIYPVHK